MGTKIGPHTLLPSRLHPYAKGKKYLGNKSAHLAWIDESKIPWAEGMVVVWMKTCTPRWCVIDWFDESSFHRGKKADNLLVLLTSISFTYRLLKRDLWRYTEQRLSFVVPVLADLEFLTGARVFSDLAGVTCAGCLTDCWTLLEIIKGTLTMSLDDFSMTVAFFILSPKETPNKGSWNSFGCFWPDLE